MPSSRLKVLYWEVAAGGCRRGGGVGSGVAGRYYTHHAKLLLLLLSWWRRIRLELPRGRRDGCGGRGPGRGLALTS